MGVYIIKHGGASPVQRCLAALIEGESLDRHRAGELMQNILNGGATQGQIGALLTAFRMKGETAEELAGAADALMAKAAPFSAPEGAVDNCGTGGDGSHSLNISTAAAFIAAGAGATVVKHGNRSVSSRSGSADVLEALGVNIAAPAHVQQNALEQAGICFLMAPAYHKAMRQVAPVRQELRTRTLFNLLGPALNPGKVRFQLVGVFSKEVMPLMAELLRGIGRERALIVHSRDGLDEISPCDVTDMLTLEADGTITESEIEPADYVGGRFQPAELAGGDAQQNAKALRELLSGNGTEGYRAAALLNAAGTLLAAGLCDNFPQGMHKAEAALTSGAAADALAILSEVTSAYRREEGQ